MVPLILYQNEIIDFLRTCTITNTYFAKQSREDVQVLLNRPIVEEWEIPYYLHLNGLYSPYDQPMYVQSTDTQTQILFDRAILAEHPRTRASFMVPSDKLLDLFDQYPTQTELIKSILYYAETKADKIIRQLHNSVSIPITSVDPDDNGQQIHLTRYDLATHPKTLALYRSMGPEYQHIQGINQTYADAVLFPIQPDDEIVTCRNLSLVACDPDILHVNEAADLIQTMNSWLEMVDKRWDVRDFTYEEYYYATWWNIVWYTLPNLLLSRRFQNIRTNFVHPFHIWEYLKSEGLQDYREILNNTQELFLYKNIRYLKENGGKQSNLVILSDNLLADFGVEIRTKAMLHKLNNGIGPDALPASTENCEVTPTIISEVLDPSVSTLQDSEDGLETISRIVEREHGDKLEPYDNDTEYRELVKEQTTILKNSKYTYLPTKLVELKKIDRDETYLELYYNFILQTTLSKYARNELPIQVEVQLEDGGYNYSYSIGELLALLYYTISKAKSFDLIGNPDAPAADGDGVWEETGPNPNGSDWNDDEPDGNRHKSIADYSDNSKFQATEGTDIIPKQIACKVAYKADFPTRPERFAMSTAPKNQATMLYLTDSYIDADAIYADVPDRRLIDNTPDRLMLDLDEQFTKLTNHIDIMRSITDYPTHRAMVNLYDYMLYDGGVTFDLVPGFDYFSDWIDSVTPLKNFLSKLDMSLDRKIEYANLSNKLIKILFPTDRASGMFATGLTDDEYTKMKALFMQLCSYNIAFIDTDRTQKLYVVTAMETISSAGGQSGRTCYIPFPYWEFKDHANKTHQIEFDDMGMEEYDIKPIPHYNVELEMLVNKFIRGDKRYDVEMTHTIKHIVHSDNHMVSPMELRKNISLNDRPVILFLTKNDGTTPFDIELLVNQENFEAAWTLPDRSTEITNHLSYGGFVDNSAKQISVDLGFADNAIGITSVGMNLFNALDLRIMSSLVTVDLHDNQLKYIHLDGLSNLKSIILNNNNLISVMINYHPQLQFLDVTNNALDEDAIEAILNGLINQKDSLGMNQCRIKLENNSVPDANSLDMINQLETTGCSITYDS